ncbi:MAG: PilZ domain-containing protein [Acidobacteriota bacterium]
MKDTGAERRNHARERTHLDVRIIKDQKKISGIIEYLSFGGAFISVEKTFLRDSIVTVEFDIPGEIASFKGNARIVWVHKDRAIGVQFLDLPSSEKIKLENVLLIK